MSTESPATAPSDAPPPRGGGSRRRILIGAAVALVVIAVLAVVSLTGSGAPAAGAPGSAASAGRLDADDATDATSRARLEAARRDPGDPLALGPVDAPVVVVEFGDFQCPFCSVFARDTEPALMAQYVASGQVRFEWRDYAYLGPESVTAAVAARAAGRQGKFWPVHDTLYARQQPENRGLVDDPYLDGIARGAGLDVARFDADRADPALRQAVEEDLRYGASLGVSGVPTFLVGDQLIFGAQPRATFTEAIDTALARTR